MGFSTTVILANCLLLTAGVAHAADLDPTQQLGGNSPWFQGPDVNDIPYEVPDGCSVDMAAFVSRHGSRYPDPGAYNGWVALSAKVVFIFLYTILLLTWTDPSCSVHRHRRLQLYPIMEACTPQSSR
jgi:hypothetical protein